MENSLFIGSKRKRVFVVDNLLEWKEGIYYDEPR